MRKYFQKISLNAINLYGVIILFLFAILFTSLVIFEEYRDFEEEEIALRENYIKTQKEHIKQETERVLTYMQYAYDTFKDENETKIKNGVVSSIEHLFDRTDSSNYIFIYTVEGINVSDPNKLHNLGKNMIDIQDVNGVYILQELIDKAKNGGGYVQYIWDNPVKKRTLLENFLCNGIRSMELAGRNRCISG